MTPGQGTLHSGASVAGIRPCQKALSSVYTCSIYTSQTKALMAEIETAKLFKHGGSQAVRLPKEFRLPGTEVRVRRLGRGVLLEPLEFDGDSVRPAVGAYKDVPVLEEGLEQ